MASEEDILDKRLSASTGSSLMSLSSPSTSSDATSIHHLHMTSEDDVQDEPLSAPSVSSGATNNNTHRQFKPSHLQIEDNPDGRLSELSSMSSLVSPSTSSDARDPNLQDKPNLLRMMSNKDVPVDSLSAPSSLLSPSTPSDAKDTHLRDKQNRQMTSEDKVSDGRVAAPSASSLSFLSTPTSVEVISSLPEEIVIYHILPLFNIEEIEPLKLVCRKWLGFVRRYYGQLRVLDLTPWDYMVDEKLLFRIIKYAVLLREIRLDRCWRGVTESSVLKMSANCHQLQVFCASRCGSLTDCAITALVEKCSKLTELDLSSCYRITDESLCSIASSAKNLRELHVSSVYGVTDFGVSQLAFKCLELKSLDVSYCYRVSNAGLEGFVNRSNKQKEEDLMLKYLRIKDCQQVTDTMVARLISVGVEVNNMF